ncbi:hypothetical protein TNCV_503641 [Trichonephila clavipes]|nr:hypothetical protein TNCV_503641 [Trichonephila clavipes]
MVRIPHIKRGHTVIPYGSLLLNRLELNVDKEHRITNGVNTLNTTVLQGENASQVVEIANGVYGVDSITANHVQFWFRRFRSGIFDVTDHHTKAGPSSEMSVKLQK